MSLLVKNLKKSFSQGNHQIDVLKSLSFQVNEGELVSLIGPSGSGKSTLLALLAGLERPDSGDIFLDSTNIVGFSETQMTTFRAKNLSLVFQQYHLVSHLTALENVALPLEIIGQNNPEELAEETLVRLGLQERLHHFPSQLSGGESQRVAIGRALVIKPKILLADEPTGNLDIETGQKVIEYFLKMIKESKTTTLLVTHSEALAQKAQRTLRLNKGLVEEVRA